MLSKTKITENEIWKTSFIIKDIYNKAEVEFEWHIDSFSSFELQKFIDDNLHS